MGCVLYLKIAAVKTDSSLDKSENNFYEMKSDVGISLHEKKGTIRCIATPRQGVMYQHSRAHYTHPYTFVCSTPPKSVALSIKRALGKRKTTLCPNANKRCARI